MNQFQISLTGEPMVMVHRGWRQPSNSRSRSSKNDRNPSHSTSKLDSRPSTSQPPIIQDDTSIPDSVPAALRPRQGVGVSKTTPLARRNAETRPNANIVQEFAFVNVTEPGRPRDPETRKLVRGHVLKDSMRKKRLMRQLNVERVAGNDFASASAAASSSFASSTNANIRLSPTTATTATTATGNPSSTSPSPSPFTSLSPTLGLDPNPSLSPIIHHLTEMGAAMYPFAASFRFNPVSPARWFDCALRDEALMHALLYTSSTYLGLLRGSTENKEAFVHGGRSVELVKGRLEDMGRMGEGMSDGGMVVEVVESTVRAVSCLAISECLRGNYDGWVVHMKGLQQMVDLKGGIATFSTTLQLKLHRADLMGASEYLVPAYFSSFNSLPKLPAQDLRHAGLQDRSVLKFLSVLPISADLCNTLMYMYGLSHSVSLILASPTVLSESQQVSLLQHIYSLRYNLLPPRYGEDGLGFGEGVGGDEAMDEVLRIGALLFVAETPREFPCAAVGPGRLVKRLRELVIRVQMWNGREAGLVLWLLFVGGMAARGEDRVWFIEQIERLGGRIGVVRWGEVKGVLEGLWWVERIHEKPCRELWDKVVVLKGLHRLHTE
ncbi:hypothetical protein VTL71DRAFT_11467 [Oculimacula yallundae]|uniref:Tachykinin family protein n=1 Tax=Oculimacula yallundae TaxID=86028 RepID=A0ABR4CST2_9HELO